MAKIAFAFSNALFNKVSFSFTSRNLFTGLLFCGMLAGTSCDKDDNNLVSQSNTIRGKVLTVDYYGRPLYGERGNIDVFLTTQNLFVETSTGNEGTFIIGNMTEGAYRLTFEGENIAHYQNGIFFSAFSPIYPVEGEVQVIPTQQLIVRSEFGFGETTLDSNSTGITITTTINPGPPAGPYEQGFRVLCDNSPGVSSTNYMYQKHFTSETNLLVASITNAELLDAGFESGDEVYLRIYADYFEEYSFQTEEGDTLFPALSDQSVLFAPVVLP